MNSLNIFLHSCFVCMPLFLKLLITLKFVPFLRLVQGHSETPLGHVPVATVFPYRINVQRKIAHIFNPYAFHQDIRGQNVCKNFASWEPTTEGWDLKLNPLSLTLCSKEHGGGGNCLYHSISGSLKENKYNVGKFDLNRLTLPLGMRLSLNGMNFKNSGFFEMKDLRKLAALAFVGVDPFNVVALQHLDAGELKRKLEFVVAGLDFSQDVTWDPKKCLQDLEDPTNNERVAKEVFSKLSSVSPVHSWGSGDDLYALANLLNVDFLLFHKNDEKLQHIKSDSEKPVCTVNLYYYDMVHFQSAGVVLCNLNSNTKKMSSVYRNFELHDNLYDLVMKETQHGDPTQLT